MTAERWQRIKTVFNGAIECSPATRPAFVRDQCGSDLELRSEVEALLASSGKAGSLLENPTLLPAAAPLAEGTLILKDRYQLERELGRGGMSVVYLARDTQLLAKRVVIKILLDESSNDPWMRQKFLQEIEALARIDHPGVVGVLDTGLTPAGKQFLVMQYLDGATLRSAMDSGGMNSARAAGIIRQIGQALTAAHEKGVWHRDLKPENIILQRLGGEDHIKLIDFGIAGIEKSHFTGEKTKVAGTLAYMAPEQFAGRACAASDTYSLAVVAYELLTGTLPGPPGESRVELPEAARASIHKAMSFRTELRHTDVREFSEQLYFALTAGESARKTAVPGAVAMAHVLFTDLVGYSLLPMDQQKNYLAELQQIVRESPQFRAAEAAGDIISLPTGDGMALAFFGDPTAPAQCALEIAKGLKEKPHLKLRMGIHSGPVYRVADVNANANVAGGGINMAQRIMDCGDAGHILVSKSVADVLLQLSQWSPYLTDLGECTVKHGIKVHVCSLATPEAGNPELPRKLAGAIPKKKSKAPVATVLALVGIAVVAGAFWIGRAGLHFRSADIQPSIAVLPFVDLSPEKNQEYFSEGLAEELLNALSKTPGLRVAARTSSFRFGGKAEDSRIIAKKLNVATILEGSVRKQSNRARIALELINAADGFQLWSDSYNTELNDIVAVQEEIAGAVIGALKVTLLKSKAPVARTVNPNAYNAYLQGRYFLERHNKDNLERAIVYFQEATKLDSGYAKGWIGLAESLSGQALGGYVPAEGAFRMARKAVERALTIDPNSGEAHAAMAWIQQFNDYDWTGADASYKKALALQPGDARLISHAGTLARIVGHLDEATTLGRRSMQLDPLSSGNCQNAGVSFYYAGLYEEAAAAFQRALDLVPEMALAHCLLGRVYLARSQPREALAEMEKEKHPALRPFGLALAYHALGQKKESEANLAELIAKFQADAGYQIAEVHAFRGEADQAFEWLERARADNNLDQLKGDPLLKNLQADPRYAALLKKIRLPL